MPHTLKHFLPTLLWGTALMLLYLMDTTGNNASLCVLRMVGFYHCPGCGIGHSIHHILHGQFAAAWQAHWLGLPATCALLYLCVQPFFHNKTKHSSYESPTNVADPA